MAAVTPASNERLDELREEAVKARQRRASVKHALRKGDLTLVEVLDLGANGVGDTIIGRLQIRAVLRSVHGWGPAKTDRLLGTLRIPVDRHLDKLSALERQAIVDAVALG